MTDSDSLDYVERLLENFQQRMDERDRRYEERFRAQDEKTTLAFDASREAIRKADAATDKRFEGVNEFRGTLSDQAATMLPRAEAATKFAAYDEKIDDIKAQIASLRESRSEGSGKETAGKEDTSRDRWVVGVVAAIVSAIITIIGILIRR